MRTVLVVEDDPDISEALTAALEDHGYGVIVAANGQQALELLRRGHPRPSLILLDLMMPVMDGWEFRAAQIAEPSLADIPVVILSAQLELKAAATRLSAAAFVKKPTDLESLLSVIETTARGVPT